MIHPFVLPVPEDARQLTGDALEADLTRRAEEAANRSAVESGMATDAVHKSVATKPTMVAGVAAESPVAIEVEHIGAASEAEISSLLSAEEHRRLGGTKIEASFRARAAKTAVLKLVGAPISELDAAELVLASKSIAHVRYHGRVYEVLYAYAQDHVTCVTRPEGQVLWHMAVAGATQ